MKQFAAALVICGALAGLGQPFLEHWYGGAARNAAPATVAEDRAPPEIGSGKVSDYVRPYVGRLARDNPDRIRLLRWCLAEGAKIKANSPSLWRRAEDLRRLCLANAKNDTAATRDAVVTALREAAAAEGSEQLVCDVETLAWGAALLETDERLAELKRHRAELQRCHNELAAAKRALDADTVATPSAPRDWRHANAIAKSIRQANRAGWNQQPAAWVTQPQPSAPAPSNYGSPYPYYVTPNPGPYYENVTQSGNQTSIYGSGPYGPFYENISNYGNQTYINGFGLYGPFYENISRFGNQTYINGSGIMPFYGGYGSGY